MIAVPAIKKMAIGWKLLSGFAVAFGVKAATNAYSSYHYGPIYGALIQKYSEAAKTNVYEIQDRKREYFYIDTSEYMNYSFDDLGDEYSTHHGPQPVFFLV